MSVITPGLDVTCVVNASHNEGVDGTVDRIKKALDLGHVV